MDSTVAETVVLNTIYGLSLTSRYGNIIPITVVKAKSKVRGPALKSALLALELDGLVDLQVAQDRTRAEKSGIGGWYDPVRGWIGYVGYTGSGAPPSYADRSAWRGAVPARRRRTRRKVRR